MLNQSSNHLTNFPYEIFPPEIQILLEKAEETLNYPIEYLGSSILSACSVAIGNTHQIKFKEGFIAKGNLYIALVGNAGDVKTHPLNFAYNFIDKADKEAYKSYKLELEANKKLTPEQKSTTEKPIYKKYILKDFTPEKLIELHSFNPRGIAIHSDELFGWIKNFGRYSSSGEQETYLSLWNGSSISVDRKSDEPIRLDNTCVNIIGTIQTKILPELGKENRSNNGFIERMLFALNENPKPVLWSDEEIDKDAVMYYHKLIERLFALDFSDGEPILIRFTEEAKKTLIDWQHSRRKDLFDDEIGTSIQAKYEVYAIRFSLIIQLIHWALTDKTKDKIELFAVKHSIKLANYFFNVALKVNDKINKTNPLSKLTKIQEQLYEKLKEVFTTEQARVEAEALSIPERTLYRIIKNTQLFSKEKHGIYKKIKI